MGMKYVYYNILMLLIGHQFVIKDQGKLCYQTYCVTSWSHPKDDVIRWPTITMINVVIHVKQVTMKDHVLPDFLSAVGVQAFVLTGSCLRSDTLSYWKLRM